ncbi:hypothetical protein SLEP1_g37994 [Rubroshorea leprosula]|uniref:Uncharacterized protein n=1 Tax=Rubroshorea leprosula TaxID=152421 RepID=A0AAV5KWE9_9ROSI|nr:hypothetical protein SLEP1_g37994 [Rubroshorea leprosula]
MPLLLPAMSLVSHRQMQVDLIGGSLLGTLKLKNRNESSVGPLIKRVFPSSEPTGLLSSIKSGRPATRKRKANVHQRRPILRTVISGAGSSSCVSQARRSRNFGDCLVKCPWWCSLRLSGARAATG